MSEPSHLQEPLWYILELGTWSINPEILIRGRSLLVALLERWDEYPVRIRISIVMLFLKLLFYDPSTLEEAPSLLTALAHTQDWGKRWLWRIAHTHDLMPSLDCLTTLAEFADRSDSKIREGALVLWEAIVAAVTSEPHGLIREELQSLRLDWRVGVELLADADKVRHWRGITLLTLSDFPIEDEARYQELLNIMAACRETDESQAWARLIRNIPMPEAQEAQWRQLLESILSQPQKYTQAILAAAMDRYMILAGQIGPDIPVDEASLGLPPVT